MREGRFASLMRSDDRSGAPFSVTLTPSGPAVTSSRPSATRMWRNAAGSEHATGPKRQPGPLPFAAGHGGFFKTAEVGQRLMAAAANVPVSVMATAGEGGAWGMALLAAYMRHKSAGETLEAYLADKVFAGQQATTIAPDPQDVAGFAAFMARYKEGLAIERAAVESLR